MHRFANKRFFSLKPKNLPKLTTSYYHNNGEDGQRLTNATIDQLFTQTAKKYSNQTALIAYSENNFKANFEQFEKDVYKLADGLVRLGFRPKDKIAIWAPNIKEYPVVQFAAAKIGVVLVTLNPLYTADEAEYAINFSECKGIICPRGILKVQNYLEKLEIMEFVE